MFTNAVKNVAVAAAASMILMAPARATEQITVAADTGAPHAEGAAAAAATTESAAPAPAAAARRIPLYRAPGLPVAAAPVPATPVPATPVAAPAAPVAAPQAPIARPPVALVSAAPVSAAPVSAAPVSAASVPATPAPVTLASAAPASVSPAVSAPAPRAAAQEPSELSGKRIVVGPNSNFPGREYRRLVVPAGKSEIIDLQGDVREVVVGNPEIADVAISTPRRISVIGRKTGETDVHVLGAGGQEIVQLEISVGPDASVVQAAIARSLPDLPVTVSAEGNALVLTGTLQSDGDVGRVATVARQFVDSNDKIVNLMRVGREQQVLIQVRVAEVQRQALKEIGTQIGVNQDTPNQFGVVRGQGSTYMLGLNPLNQFASTFSLEGIKDVVATLSLLETRGLIRNLAEPNLVAVSGETASMLAGGEVPIPVPQQNSITIEYKPFGVSLAFVPVILDSGAISLKLSTEVSSISPDHVDVPLLTGKAQVPAFIVRRASSTVEMASGGSLMIAGLLQNDVLSSVNGVPALMNLPVLGQLFRSESFKRNETELVVIVTASLVRATPPKALVAATDSFTLATDTDRWFFGKLLGRFTPGFVQDADRLKHMPTSFGFSLDGSNP